MELDTIRKFLAEEIERSGLFQKDAKVVYSKAPELGQAGSVHVDWPLTEKGPYSGDRSREITIRIGSAPVEQFMHAEARERGRMVGQLLRVIKIRIAEGGYNEVDPSHPPFIVTIDEHSLD